MNERITQFISALRSAGVRVSLAESQDAFRAIEALGIQDRETFKTAVRATLIKDYMDIETFDHMFPMFFQVGTPPLLNPADELDEQSKAMLQAALEALMGDMSKMMSQLMQGMQLNDAQMGQAAWEAGLDRLSNARSQSWMERRMQNKLGLDKLMEEIEKFLQQLSDMGMSEEALQQLEEGLLNNLDSLEQQVQNYVGQNLAEKMADQPAQKFDEAKLEEKPFQALNYEESDHLRKLVTRLAAKLRTRAALRMKRGKGPQVDIRATMRQSLRTGGIPFEIEHKKRREKPKFVLICDVSTSMRAVVEFLLRLVYEMQDQFGRTRSFAFIDHMEEVTADLAHDRPDVAIPNVLTKLPPGYYSTDLGSSLAGFFKDFSDSVDARTTVIFCGDGRNNYYDPRLDLAEALQRRAKRVLWFNPEAKRLWGTGDSDMHRYADFADEVYQVRNLKELAAAVDELFV